MIKNWRASNWRRIGLSILFLGTAVSASIGAAADGSQYLPLSVGKKWVLRSKAVPMPMVFEVTGKTADSFQIRWDNPFIPSELSLVPRGGKIYISAVTMGEKASAMPADTLYWDFTAAKGATWKNSIGTLSIVARDKVVKADDKTYTNVIEIKENNQFWLFAPGVGFVQFGEGGGAFVLDQKASNTATQSSISTPAMPQTTASGARTAGLSAHTGRLPLIGVQANIFANEPLTPSTANARFQQSVNAGVTFQGFSATWAKLEPSKGHYWFNDIDFNVGQSAGAGLPIAYTLRIIDTGMKAVPSWLKDTKWQDPKMQDQLLALIDALAPHFKGRLKWVMIGNEIDPYFAKHPDEGTAYAQLFRAAAARFKALIPGVEVSHTVTFAGLPMENGALKPVFDESDFLSLTYYPASGDFRFRDPSTVSVDFPKMMAAAGGKKILLQEVGYSSSSLNDSSEDKQAQFYTNVFNALRIYSDKFIGANFLFMSDFSNAVVDDLAKYYNASGAERFRAFLQTLGMFDGQGKPKKSWAVFQEWATKMKS